MSRTLVVTPLKSEFEGICRHFFDSGHSFEALPGRTPGRFFSSLNLELAIGGHGKAKFATVTQYLIGRGEEPGTVIAAGAAGALTNELDFGDVILGAQTIEHDYKIRFGEARPAPRYCCNQELLESVQKSCRAELPFTVIAGGIASGDEDIVDAQRAAELHAQTGALCVAWEGAGGAKAARFHRIPFLEIRGITDSANSDALADFKVNMQKAMTSIGSVLQTWLS